MALQFGLVCHSMIMHATTQTVKYNMHVITAQQPFLHEEYQNRTICMVRLVLMQYIVEMGLNYALPVRSPVDANTSTTSLPLLHVGIISNVSSRLLQAEGKVGRVEASRVLLASVVCDVHLLYSK